MSLKSAPRRPSYLLHRQSGNARTKINGRLIYLGRYGSPESKQKYEALVSDWLANLETGQTGALTCDDLSLMYLEHARQYYVKNDKPTHEVLNVRIALRHLVATHGSTLLRIFSPKCLIDVRNSLVASGMVRRSVNQHLTRIKRAFKWATENELVPPTVHMGLAAVPGLRYGRSKAKESEPVKPVPEHAIAAIQPHVSRQVWALVQLQLCTGMRPGEAVQMRGCDLNMAGSVWEYRPASHKTQHHGRERVVMMGPVAQEIVHQFFKSDLSACLFSPVDALEEKRATRRQTRRTPMTPSQQTRKRKEAPIRSARQAYDVNSYRQAIQRACEVAFAMPVELRSIPADLEVVEIEVRRKEAAAWRAEYCWNPAQLRHNAATRLRREFGIETARVILGHSHAFTTEIYAELDHEKARGAVARIG